MISKPELELELAALESLYYVLQKFCELPPSERELVALRIHTLRDEETTRRLHAFVMLLCDEVTRAVEAVEAGEPTPVGAGLVRHHDSDQGRKLPEAPPKPEYKGLVVRLLEAWASWQAEGPAWVRWLKFAGFLVVGYFALDALAAWYS